MADANATPEVQVQPQPPTAPPVAPEQAAGTPAPITAPKPQKTPREPRTRGVPAAPAALAGVNTVAVAGGAATSAAGPVVGLAVAGGLVVGAGALALRQRRRVKQQRRRRAERQKALRNGGGTSPSAVRNGRWTGSGGSSPRTRAGGGGSGSNRPRSVNPRSGPNGSRSGSGGLGGGSGRHRSNGGRSGSGSGLGLLKNRSNRGRNNGGSGSGSNSPRSRRLNGSNPGRSDRTRTPLLFSQPGRPSALRTAIGPRPAGQRRGGLIRNGNGQRRRPFQALANGARAMRRGATRVANGGRRIGRGARAVGRGFKKAWNLRPTRAVRRWTIGAARRAWGIIGPAVGAALAGVHAALRRRGWRGIFQAMSTTWGRLRARWGPKKGKHAVAAAAATPPAPTVPATVVVRPAHVVAAPGGSTGLTGGVSAVTARIIEMSREMVGAASMYNPEGMMQIGNDMASMPEIIRNVANAIQGMTLAVQNGETPMNPAIVDSLKSLHASLIKASHEAEDLKPAFESLHNVDIKRIRQPRPGEEMWDLTKNRDFVGRG